MTLKEQIGKLKEDIKKSLSDLEQEDLTIDSIEGYIQDVYGKLNTITDLLMEIDGDLS